MEKHNEKSNQYTKLQLETLYQLVKTKDVKSLSTLIETANYI